MKRIILVCTFILLLGLPAQAFTRNPYGIFYAHVYNNGKYEIKILDLSKKSIAYKAGIKQDSIIKALNNNSNLNLKNTRMYFDASTLPITVTTPGDTTETYTLKAKNLKVIQKNEKLQTKLNNNKSKQKYNKNITTLNKYLSKYPNDIYARSYLVNNLILNGQFGEAITALDYMYNKTNSPAVLGTMSSLYLSINDNENAKKYARQTLEIDSNEITANATMFVCNYEDMKYVEALKHANTLVEHDSKSYTSYFYKGLAEMKLKNYMTAYKDLDKAYTMAQNNKYADIPSIVAPMVEVSDLMIRKTLPNSKQFVEVPSWFDICPGEYVYSNGKNPKWNLYWAKRRDAYLRSVYSSINSYTGQDLYKSYANIIKKEYRQNEDYKIEREHTWNQERREEIYKYTKDILVTGLQGAALIKAIPQRQYVHHSGTVNQNINFSGSISRYNHHYFH